MTFPSPLPYTRLSLGERDRRWTALRGWMDRTRIDCVIVPNSTGHSGALQADTRYLTNCGGGTDFDVASVFPLHGDVAVIATECERWRGVQDWVADLREAAAAFGTATAAKLRELSLPHNRVAVGGLGANPRQDGAVSYGFMNALTDAFPLVEWVDATDALRSLRMVKSAEEISLLKRSAALVDHAFERVRGVAMPHMADHEVWGAAMGELCRLGSEMPVYNAWGSGLRPTPLARPSHGELVRGHLIVSELEAAYSGYRARGAQAFAVEDCDPAWRDLYAMHAEYWQECFGLLRVGRTLGEVAEACEHLTSKVVPEGPRYEKPSGRVVIQGAGLGADGPLLTGRRNDQTPGQAFAPGWAFLFKPSLRVEIGGRPYLATWGDTVVLAESGPQCLGARRPGLIITES